MFQYIYGQAMQEKYNQKVYYDLTWYNLSSSHRYRELETHESFRLGAFGIQPEMISESTSRFFNSKVGKVYSLGQKFLAKLGIRFCLHITLDTGTVSRFLKTSKIKSPIYTRFPHLKMNRPKRIKR